MANRITPSEGLLTEMIKGVLMVLMGAGEAFTAYKVTLSLRGLHEGYEILTHARTNPDYDGPTVGPIVHALMSLEAEWTSRVMKAEDGQLADTWIQKLADSQFNWATDDPIDLDDMDDYDDYDDDDDDDDEDESLFFQEPMDSMSGVLHKILKDAEAVKVEQPIATIITVSGNGDVQVALDQVKSILKLQHNK